MSFEADLKTHLGVAALAALVTDCVWPVIRPEGNSTFPAITYQVIALDPQANLDGIDASLREIRVQIDVWARAHSDILAVADALMTRMDTAATSFTSVLLPGSGADSYEPDTKLYRRTLEWSCWYRAT